MTHTPGPWETIEKRGHSRDGRLRKVICKDSSPDSRIAVISLRGIPDGDREVHNANAALIAAAPELLAACIGVMEAVANSHALRVAFSASAGLHDVFVAVDTAIAKATSVKEHPP